MKPQYPYLTKKLFFALVSLLLTIAPAFSQNSANYAFSTNTVSSLSKDINGNAIDMSTGTTQLLGPGIDGTYSSLNNVGFTFSLMGKSYTQFALQDDGIITFGPGMPLSNVYDILAGTPQFPRISAFCANMRVGTGTGKIHFKLVGSVPNRVLVVEYKEMQLFLTAASSGTSTYQVRFYENGTIEFVYGAMSVADISVPVAQRSPSIGFYIGSTPGSFVSVSYASHTTSTTGSFYINPAITTTGAITELTSTTDSTRRAYVFVPDSPVAPTNLTFNNISATSMNVNWVDNDSNEMGYQVFRSQDNGVTYTLQSTLPANTTSYQSNSLMPNKTYYWSVITTSEASTSDSLKGFQSTANAPVVRSKSTGGKWNDTATWVGGVVPVYSDSVVIADSAKVIINTGTATCFSLTVGGRLVFDSAQAETLTVYNEIYIGINGQFTAGSGSLTTHLLRLGGNSATSLGAGSLKVDGIFDMQTTAGVAIQYYGLGDAKIEGSPIVLDFRTIMINKGVSSTNRPVVEIQTGFTVQGGNTTGLISTHTAGLLRIGGLFFQSNPIYTAAAYTIPLNGGLHLNNPNFTITSTNGSPICNGLLQVSQGIFNVTQTAAQRLDFGTGSVFVVDGGLVIAAGAIYTSNAITFNFSSGIVKVATVGNSTSNLASFGIITSGGVVNWTGGTLYIEQKSTGATQQDYHIIPGITGGGGALQIGTSLTPANTNFNIKGNVPSLVVDSSKTATLLLNLNVFGNIVVNTGSVLKLNGYSVLQMGNTLTNHGFIDGRVANSNWEFSPSVSGHTYLGTGVDTLLKITQKDTNSVVINKPIVAYGVNFNSRSPLTQSNNIILGNGLSQAVTVQVGLAGYTNGNVGIFDTVPTFNLGTGLYNLSYQQEGAMRTTGIEIPPTRTINNLIINNSNHINLTGGVLNVTGYLTLTSGRFITDTANLIKISNTQVIAISNGSTSAYVDGPLLRKLPASLKTPSIYSFPIGKGSFYNQAELVNAGTNAGGTVDVLVESFNNAPIGTADHLSIDTVVSKYWTIAIPSGKANIDSAKVKLYNTALTPLNKVGYADSVSGIFRRISNGPVSAAISTNKLVGDTAIEGVFATAEFWNPVSGTFLVGANKTAPNYRSLTEAIANIVERRVIGDIVLLIDSDYSAGLETFPIAFPKLSLSDSTFQVLIKPNTGVNPIISGNNTTAIIRFLDGAKNYVFDGSNNGTSSQNIFIQNTSTTGAVVMFHGLIVNQGVQNCTFKNTIIKAGSSTSAYGLIVGGSFVSLSSYGVGHKSLLIKNNTIYNCSDGIVISGESASRKVSGITLLGNTIGTDTSTFYTTRNGIYVINADSVSVLKNTIKNVKANGVAVVGLLINDNVSQSIFDGNRIKGVSTINTTGGACGILVNSAGATNNIRISNNTISDIVSVFSSSAVGSIGNTFGIRLVGGTNIKLYYNTVHLHGVVNTSTNSNRSAALFIPNPPMSGLDIRNNIFSNTLTGVSATSKHYALACFSSVSNSLFDYNNFIANSTQGVLLNLAGTDVNTLTELKTSTATNTNSVNINPRFLNDSNLMVGYGDLTGLGYTLPDISVDIDDSIRSNPPTMGAYERKRDILGPAISYTPASKQSGISATRLLSDFVTITDYTGVDTISARPRLYYRKSNEANAFGDYPRDNDSSFNGWKYIEATNTVSPFSFTIDYTRLRTIVQTWDTILYFVASQDIIGNVTANPLSGFSAINIDSITGAPSSPNRYTIYDSALAGTYMVGAGNTYPNFSNLTTAINALKIRGVKAPVVLTLTDTLYSASTETLPITISPIEGTTVANTITIKPDSGKKVAIIGSSSTGLINLDGADNIIIDGSNNGTISRDLYIQNTTASGVGVMFQGTTINQGVNNCTLKNTIIKGLNNTSSYGVIVGGPTVSINSSGIGNNNIQIQNNQLYNFCDAIVVSGTTSSKAVNIRVSENVIGTDSALFTTRRHGIYSTYSDSLSIEHNIIKNVKSLISNVGIYLTSYTTNCTTNGNTVKGIYSTVSSGSAYGVRIGGVGIDNVILSNNAISDIITGNNSTIVTSPNIPHGIRLEGGTNVKIYHNTVHLYGSPTVGTGLSYSTAFSINQTGLFTGLDIRNNIFSNNMTGINPNSKHYAFINMNSLEGVVFDNNNFITNSAQGVLMFQNTGTLDVKTLDELKTLTNTNVHSVSINPQFLNDSNLAIGYGALTGLGSSIAGLNFDIDDSLRADPPTLGAYERKTDLVGPAILYTPLTKSYLDTVRVFSGFANITDYGGVDTLSAKPRMYFRKSSDANVFGSYPANNNSSFNGWKVVEASNATSPFDFTIDYQLLASGSVSLWDTIMYFVVAQDVDSNITSNPSVGFRATEIDSIISAPVIPNRYVIYDSQLAGTYLVGATQTSPNFNSLTSAISAINARGISAPVEFQLTDSLYSAPREVFPIAINPIEGATSSNTLTIRPASGKKVAIIGTSASGLFNLNGVDHITIDGSNNGTTSRDLFIQNTNISGVGLMFQGTIANQGVQNAVLKNTLIKGARSASIGIIVGGTTVGLASNGVGHNNLVVRNNMIYNCRDAAVISGTSSTSKVIKVSLIENILGTDTVAFYNSRNGVYLVNVDSALISNNTIKNIRSDNFYNPAGITIDNYTTNSLISANTIKGIDAWSGSTAKGINIESGTGCNNIDIRNNIINDIRGYSTNASINNYAMSGIRITGGSNIKLYFNTVHLNGSLTDAGSSAALAITTTTLSGLDIRNNIFSNNLNSTYVSAKQFSLACYTPFPTSVFDYNNFVTSGSQGVLMSSYNGTTTLYTPTLDGLKTLTNANANSININPLFPNDSTLIPYLGTIEGMGIAIPGVTTDIKDSVRSNPPTLGAYERTQDLKSPTITYTALDSTTQLVTRTFSVAISDLSGVDTIVKPRVYYKKSTDANVFGNYPADNNSSFNGWKYTEATSTTSPFSFTMDYSLLTSGAAVPWEKIQYFVVAQDVIVPTNVSASPATGFLGSSVSSILKAPNVPNEYLIKDVPLAGSYNIGSAYTYPNFTTLAEAELALRKRGVGGPVVFELTDAEYYIPPITFTEITGTSTTNTITIKPASGNRVKISGTSTGAGLITLDGMDHMIIDGSNNGTTSQDLLIQNTSFTGIGVAFLGSVSNHGVQNCWLKNTIVKGFTNSSSSGISVSGFGGSHNLTIQRNTIYNCKDAVVLTGAGAGSEVKSVKILNNTIGTDSVNLWNTRYGVNIANADSIECSYNTIINIKAASSVNVAGVYIGNNTAYCKINGNTIRGIQATYTYNYGAYGINIETATDVTDITISNNAISDIIARNIESSSILSNRACGIRLGGGTNIKLYFNTVRLFTLPTTTIQINASSALLIASNTMSGLDVRNNVFANSIVNSSDLYPVQYVLTSYYNIPSSIIDYNDYIAGSPQCVLMNAYSGGFGTNFRTLAEIRAMTNANTHSVSIDPLFVSNISTVPNAGILQNMGENIPGINTDILDSVRSGVPSIGAYEYGIDGLGPTIAYTPLTHSLVSTNRLTSGFATITDYSGVNTTDAKPRLYYKKKSESNVLGVYPADNRSTFNGWKYVESSDSASPFGFNIDYALLSSGGVSLWDTIQYFVVSQDQLDTSHVSANPSNGFVATSINSIANVPTTLNSFIVIDQPLAGNYLVGASQVYPNFKTIAEAFRSLNLCGVSAAVTLSLTDSLYSGATENFPLTLAEINGASALNTVTIKPALGAKVAIVGSSTSIGLINLDATDYFIIDGSNNGTSSQDLFIQNTYTSGGAVLIFQGAASNGCQNSTLKNTIIKGGYGYGTYGVSIGGQLPFSDGGGHAKLTIENNIIYSCGKAFVLSGIQSSGILRNTIGSDSAGMIVLTYGIFLRSADSIEMAGNQIKNINGSGGYNNTGLYIYSNVTNTVVSKNIIRGIKGYPDYLDYNDANGTYGIHITGSGTNNITLSNNVIENINTLEYWSTTRTQFRLFGIKIESGSNIRLYHNSVHLSGELDRGSGTCLYIKPESTTGLDIRNNTFSNVMYGGYYYEGRSYAYCQSSQSTMTGAIFDYNNFYVSGSFGILMASKSGASIYGIPTLAGLKAATNANEHSVNINPRFNNANLVLGEGTLAGLGTPIAGITDDILDSLRSNPPTIGAVETERDMTGPTISFTVIPEQKLLSNLDLPGFATITDYSGVNTTTSKPRLYYKKSVDANVIGNNAPSFNGWKSVESNDTASPFGFVIDYSKLTTGAAHELDTIQYFVVAQDLNSEVNVNAFPSNGFAAVRVDSIFTPPISPQSYIIDYTPLAGNYLVGAGKTAPNYPTLTAAVADLNKRGISSSVVFQLTSALYNSSTETFPLTINPIEKFYDTSSVTFRPYTNVRASIVGNVLGNGLFNLTGAERVVFDGSNNGTTSQDLFVNNTSYGGYGIWLIGDEYDNGCSFSEVKNCIVKGGSSSSYGIFVGGNTTIYSWGGSISGGLGKGGSGHDSVRVENNTIYNCAEAVTVCGLSSLLPVRGIQIINNRMGVDSSFFPFKKNGMSIMFADGAIIKKNIIKNVKSPDGIQVGGIYMGDYMTNGVITQNEIKSIYATNTTYGVEAVGICVNAPGSSNILISNNVVSDIQATFRHYNFIITRYAFAYGIRIAYGSDVKLYHNTVHLYGSVTGTMPGRSAAFSAVDYNMDIRNNIFSNTMSSNMAGSKHYAIELNSSAFICDNNNYYVSGTQGILMHDSANNVDINTLPGIQGIDSLSGLNLNSVSVNPLFISNTNLRIGANTLQGLGVAIPEVTTDFVDSLRNDPPTIGAYEGVSTPLPVSLLTFEGRVVGSDVQLDWSTASEVNNNGFVVERSYDGRVFERIGFVNGAGNSSKTIRYTMMDKNAFYTQNVLYYRLKQLDFDGQFTYSDIVRVSKEATRANGFSVYPNPFTDQYSISFNASANGVALLEMLNLQGKVVVSQTSDIVKGANTLEISDSQIAEAGVYVIRLTIRDEVHYMKIVKN